MRFNSPLLSQVVLVDCGYIIVNVTLELPTISARYQRAVLNGMIGILLAFLSIPVVQNLLSSSQQMNTSFDSFRLVNTYGAFGRLVTTLYLAQHHVTDPSLNTVHYLRGIPTALNP